MALQAAAIDGRVDKEQLRTMSIGSHGSEETDSIGAAVLREQFAQALAIHRAGQLREAEQRYRQILAVEPHHDESLHLLGVIACQAGQPAASIELIERAITLRGNVAVYHSNLALALQQLGRLDDAVRHFERTVALQPDYAAGYANLATLHLLQGRADAAAAQAERALALQPDHAEACYSLAAARARQGRLAEAVAGFERVSALRPDYADAYYSLGVVLQQANRSVEAIRHLDRAVALKPDNAEFHHALGCAHYQHGDSTAAVPCYEKAIALRPDYAEPHSNLALILKERGDLAGAAAQFDRALALKPRAADVHLNRALIRLMTGDFSNGWRQYEARWDTRQLDPDRRQFTVPRWDGSDGRGRKILLWAEQGLGDSLQFCRYVPLLAARGWRVVVEVQDPLVRLLGSLKNAQVLPIGGAARLAIDCHCPMMSLPLLFGTGAASIPAAVPYLAPAPADRARWRDRLGTGGPKVGLVWSGNPGKLSAMHALVDTRRSIALDRLAPLLAVEGVRFVSLQKDLRPGEVPTSHGMLDPMSRVKDFADTAAIVAQLDLVISVDTSVVHLAGAMGKPVWLLNRFDSCWRWLRGRDDSPWYPTLRQFRQPAPDDWDSVVAAAAAALRRALQDSPAISATSLSVKPLSRSSR
jgi:Flp pilus assembly protein TadD